MTPWLQDADVTLYHGDVLDVLREFPAESVDCCVTSPPYWGLRDYGTGAWEGGDAECDHRIKVPQGVQSSSTITGAEPHPYLPYRDTCGKCGATRIDQQLGLEPTPEEYVDRMVEVFREVRRVLASHGTVWLNLGDSYAGSNASQGGDGSSATYQDGRAHVAGARARQAQRTAQATPMKLGAGLKPKDLVGIPWRVAFALQADGWYLRSDIIWAKPNPMPESVTDRPTKAHEYVFLLSKQPRYFFDQEAVREAVTGHGGGASFYAERGREWQRNKRPTDARMGGAGRGLDSALTNPLGRNIRSVWEIEQETLDPSLPPGKPRLYERERQPPPTTPAYEGQREVEGSRWSQSPGATGFGSAPHGRNVRSVWEIATQPYPEAHFATFPEELARRCIAAGCPEQVCRVCGKARERVVEVGERVQSANGRTDRPESIAVRGTVGATSMLHDGRVAQKNVLGFTDCDCLLSEGTRNEDERAAHGPGVSSSVGNALAPHLIPSESKYRPGIVLDPFMGSGTVAHVARKLGRHAVGIDLNESYLELAARRLQQQSLFAEVAS